LPIWPAGGVDLGGDVADVPAAVACLRERHGDAARLEHPQPDAYAEDVHLPAGVVHVVLPVDRVPRRLEQVRDARAVGGVTPVTDVQGAGRVGRDELDQDAGRFAFRTVSVFVTLPQHAGDLAVQRFTGQPEVDEPGASDLDFLDQLALGHAPGDRLRELARLEAHRFRDLHRDVGREVAVPRITRALDDCTHRLRVGMFLELGHARERLA